MRWLLCLGLIHSTFGFSQHAINPMTQPRAEAPASAFDESFFSGVLSGCPIYDAEGKERPPRDPEGGIAGAGILVTASNQGGGYQASACTITQSERGKAVTAGHCTTDPSQRYFLIYFTASGERRVTRLSYDSIQRDESNDYAQFSLPSAVSKEWNVWSAIPGDAKTGGQASLWAFDDLRIIPSESGKLRNNCGWAFKERRFRLSGTPRFLHENRQTEKVGEVSAGPTDRVHLEIDPDHNDGSGAIIRHHSGALITSPDGRTVYGMLTEAVWERQFTEHVRTYGGIDPADHDLYYTSHHDTNNRSHWVRVRPPATEGADGRFLYAIGRRLR